MGTVEGGGERTEFVEAVPDTYLNKDGRLNLSVDGVRPRRWREKMDLSPQMEI